MPFVVLAGFTWCIIYYVFAAIYSLYAVIAHLVIFFQDGYLQIHEIMNIGEEYFLIWFEYSGVFWGGL